MRKLISYSFISIAIALAISIVNLSTLGWRGLENAMIDFVVNFIFALTLTVVNSIYFDQISKVYPWEVQPRSRLIAGVVGSVVLTMVTLFFLLILTRVIVYDRTWKEAITNQHVDFYITGLVITLIVSLIFHAFYFYKELQSRRVKEQKVIAGTATAQFDALKSQLDPHFLFNSLNVLVSLIEENPKAATRFTTSLSKVYRYVLEQRNKELVSIEEELTFARTYVNLLKWRFEDSLEVSIPEAASDAELKVVPLSLQLLLENAVKHNVVSDSKPLQLRIYEENSHLVVENNLQIKDHVKKGSGVGLKNIASRYALLSYRQMTITQNEHSFKVQIPALTEADLNTSTSSETMETIEDIKLVKARERVADIKEFYDNIVRSAAIIAFLAVVNYLTSDFPWVIFPAIGLSIGMLFNYFKTFNQNIFLGKGWEERKISELMNNKDF
jgi:sensor histidine kinase YesM